MTMDRSKNRFGTYDFRLTADEEVRAAKLHAGSVIVDLLYWGPCTYLSITEEMEREMHEMYEVTHDLDYTTFMGTYLAQIHAARGRFPEFKTCWDDSGVTAGGRHVEYSTWEIFAATFGRHVAMFDNLPWIVKALHADDIFQAKAEGKHAAWITTQLGTGIGENFIDLIEPSYDMGLRMIQLTYNPKNLIGSGCGEHIDTGMTNYGINVLSKMNDLGIIVDTAHVGRATTLDVCRLSRGPVIASHTSAEKLYMHVRAKSDEEIQAIADTGGVIGVNAVPFFIASAVGNERPTIELTLDHIDYLSNLVGWKHVAIGTDYPMGFPKSILKKILLPMLLNAGHRKEDGVERVLDNLVGFDDYRDFPNFTRGLVKRGYTDEQIKGILGENFLRVFKAVCG